MSNLNQQKTSKKDENQERERIFNEFKQSYFDIIDEIPLDLGRKLSLISDLEKSVQECQIELHEDLIEYTKFAQSITIDETNSIPRISSSNPPNVDEEEDYDEDEKMLKNQLKVLAQPMLWGAVKVPTIKSESERRASSALPIELRALLMEISEKMNRLTKLSRDKLDLSESIYQQLDLQLKRLDNDLESYQDLEDLDARAELSSHRRDQPQQGQLPEHETSHLEQESRSESESSSHSSAMDSDETKRKKSQSSTPQPKRATTFNSSRNYPKTSTSLEKNRNLNHSPSLSHHSCKSSRTIKRSTTTSPIRRSASKS